MTAQLTLPTHEARQPNKRVYRFDPHMAPVESEAVPGTRSLTRTDLDYADHLDICKRAIATMGATNVELGEAERRMAFLERRLDDPELENHPARDAAWDRLRGYRSQHKALTELIHVGIAEIDSHGRYLASVDLRWIGNHTTWDVIERVHDVEPETRGMATWKSIAENTAPF